jgi:hypothetical protein
MNEDIETRKKKIHARYNASPLGAARYARYRATSKGLINELRWYEKRKRGEVSAS